MPARHPPRNLDQPLHAILCRIRARGGAAGWYAVERAAEDMTRAATIRDIKAGQVEDVVAVLAFNPVEHVADDVTEDIAIAIAGSFDSGRADPGRAARLHRNPRRPRLRARPARRRPQLRDGVTRGCSIPRDGCGETPLTATP
jgi:hypothetical protein